MHVPIFEPMCIFDLQLRKQTAPFPCQIQTCWPWWRGRWTHRLWVSLCGWGGLVYTWCSFVKRPLFSTRGKSVWEYLRHVAVVLANSWKDVEELHLQGVSPDALHPFLFYFSSRSIVVSCGCLWNELLNPSISLTQSLYWCTLCVRIGSHVL